MTKGVFRISFPPPERERLRADETGASSPLTPGDFVGGPENRLARLAAESAARLEPTRYNPLVLTGPPNAGKSHLARGIARQLHHDRPELAQTCLAAAEFAQEFGLAAANRELEAFRSRYRQLGLLVLEDLQQVVDKQAAQQELVLTLDALLEQESLVVVTSRVSPRALRLAPALVSRLSAGLEVPLAFPGSTARLAILQELAELRGMQLPAAAARLLADCLRGSVPELSGALATLQLWETADAVPLDAAAARRYLLQHRSPTRTALRSIAARTARCFALRLSDLKSSSRERAVVRARGVAMYLARQLTNKSLEQIGAFFGGRDHSTVLHACRRIDELLKTDPAIRQAVEQLRAELLPV